MELDQRAHSPDDHSLRQENLYSQKLIDGNIALDFENLADGAADDTGKRGRNDRRQKPKENTLRRRRIGRNQSDMRLRLPRGRE